MAKSMTVKSTDCGFDQHSREWTIYLHFSHWCRGKAQCWVPLLNTQCLQNSAKSGKRSVLTLDTLCLPCCEQDTGWSWLVLYILLEMGNVWNNMISIHWRFNHVVLNYVYFVLFRLNWIDLTGIINIYYILIQYSTTIITIPWFDNPEFSLPLGIGLL